MKTFLYTLSLLAVACVALPAVALDQQSYKGAPPAYLKNASSAAALEEIDKLLDAKVDVEVVKAYIQNSPATFHLSASDIIALKDRGATSDILRALIEHQPQSQAPVASAPAMQAMPPQGGPGYSYPSVEAPMTPQSDSYPSYGYDSAYPGYYPYYYPTYAYASYGWPYFYFGYYPYCYSHGYYGHGYCGYYGHGYYGHGYYGHGGLVATHSGGFTATRSVAGGFHASGGMASFHGGAAGFHGGGGFSGGGFHGGGGGGHGGGGGGHR